MADYTKTKSYPTKVYPVEAKSTSDLFGRIEPMLTPELLISRYLKSQKQEIENMYSDDELKQEINLAANEFELLTHLSVTNVQHKERLPFDRALYNSFVYVKTNNGPVLSVEKMAITSSNGENVFLLPPEWIDMGYAHKRQINMIPILGLLGVSTMIDGKSSSGLVFLQAISHLAWVPAFFEVDYTVGISKEDGQVPIIVNSIIGMIAAISILSNLQAGYKYTSTSMGQDGISQSASGPGNQVYAKRIEDLENKKERELKRLKAIFNQKYFLSNI